MVQYPFIMPTLIRFAAFMSEVLSIITIVSVLGLSVLVQKPIEKPTVPTSAGPSTIDELVEEMYELKHDRGRQ